MFNLDYVNWTTSYQIKFYKWIKFELSSVIERRIIIYTNYGLIV